MRCLRQADHCTAGGIVLPPLRARLDCIDARRLADAAGFRGGRPGEGAAPGAACDHRRHDAEEFQGRRRGAGGRASRLLGQGRRLLQAVGEGRARPRDRCHAHDERARRRGQEGGLREGEAWQALARHAEEGRRGRPVPREADHRPRDAEGRPRLLHAAGAHSTWRSRAVAGWRPPRQPFPDPSERRSRRAAPAVIPWPGCSAVVGR